MTVVHAAGIKQNPEVGVPAAAAAAVTGTAGSDLDTGQFRRKRCRSPRPGLGDSWAVMSPASAIAAGPLAFIDNRCS